MQPGLKQLVLASFSFILTTSAWASAPKVGRDAAAKYFQKNPSAQAENYRQLASETLSAEERYLMFGASLHTKSDSFNWGRINKESDVGKWGVDMTYRLETTSLIDYSLRVSYNEYSAFNQRANKLSFMYAVMLPDAASKFPLYFGAAAGPGVFLTQLSDESAVSLDYQLFLGLRIFNMFDTTGFYIEGGMKNHLQLTSDGQVNGTYIAGGAIFTF